jgi:hypothetical protein
LRERNDTFVSGSNMAGPSSNSIASVHENIFKDGHNDIASSTLKHEQIVSFSKSILSNSKNLWDKVLKLDVIPEGILTLTLRLGGVLVKRPASLLAPGRVKPSSV